CTDGRNASGARARAGAAHLRDARLPHARATAAVRLPPPRGEEARRGGTPPRPRTGRARMPPPTRAGAAGGGGARGGGAGGREGRTGSPRATRELLEAFRFLSPASFVIRRSSGGG